MKIVERNITDLNPAEYNPREMTELQNEQLSTSLLTFGFVDPIVVNKNPKRMDVIIGGHQRCRVWQQMGNKTIPTVEVNLSLEMEKELNIRLNHGGQWDWDKLANNFETKDLIEWGFEAKDFGVNFEPPEDDENIDSQSTRQCPDCGYKW